ncbi:maleylacetoacetate isomerase [Colwellia sp. MB02u-18]|uniref:maleylacetoacetate isomerase n=1 Tax=unclassified Colwellia TaxID=196834 RepID=UPI0015F5E4B5|nr:MULTISPECIES: maleylacetoacetate isomerase [unclassified Colwellia]MBA6223867.1 maleylacetoacetate isomerase [Colwellia sp. MB3u-45]MBA6267426.1 maleylacetoacetate isomerase [Colwellia sp. MB3u-43]MBA6297436.1 maleylacetoacetate isomerase [Colwellia sp. MB02u-9]MBA6320048.1 maleylacetoacetate isomerase [Colwellia sp. MB02u-19]MBA6324882.1 maleylacetoacetate isomerase [Colwellia sp. MB02u-18]
MKLYGYWRSSAAYRVRIAMHLKGLTFESVPVHLVKDGGEQHKKAYTELNPTHLVPTLIDDDVILHQSIAIVEYLDDKYPSVAIYPENIVAKAKVKALALDVACEMHPVNNLRVQQYLVNHFSLPESDKLIWSHHWMNVGFLAVEQQLKVNSGKYCFGDIITMADICLVPQVYNAYRFNLDMSEFPNICRVAENCNQHAAFIAALPENQADAQ